MSEEVEKKILKQAEGDPLLLEYDHLKHLSTLSLAALGGILSLSQLSPKIPRFSLALVIACVSLGGALALMCIEQIVAAKRNGKPISKFYTYLRSLAVALFMGGVGVFLGVFSRAFY
jgi:hypothetical protein